MIIYLLKLNLILALLCLLFQVLMHRDTFFGVRRLMLWGIYATAFLLPLCDVQALLTADIAATDMAEAYASYVLPTIEVTAMRVSTLGIEQSEPGCGMWFVGMMALWAILYLIPVVWMTLKLLWQIAYIIYLRCTCERMKSERVKSEKYELPNTTEDKGNSYFSLGGEADIFHFSFYYFPRPCSPFSFGPWIFIHPEGMDEQTLREVIIHEQAHVRGWHTLDILFSQVVCILFWWNPAAWLMRREVRMNLEFIADKTVCDVLVKSERVKSEKDVLPSELKDKSYFSLGGKADIFHFSLIRDYQYRLLGFSLQKNVATIANNFNVLPLKRRIIMMNLRRTRRTGMVKYILFVPVAAAMLLLSNIDSLARTIADKAPSPLAMTEDPSSAVPSAVFPPKPSAPKRTKADPGETPNITKPDTCIKPIDEETLFVVNGRQMSADEFKRQPNLRADNIEHATILGGESATAVYGEKGHKGAIIIETKDSINDKVYEKCEQLPEYSGGEAALYQFIAQNIRYPKAAMDWGVQGRVLVHFIVEKDGTLSNISASKVVDSKSGKELAEVTVTHKIQALTPEQVEAVKHQEEGMKALKAEAERVVKALPERWKPGRQHGQPVRVSFHLPISFRLR